MLGIIMTVVFIVMVLVCLLGTGIAQRKAAWWLVNVILGIVVFYSTAWIGYGLDPEDPMSIVVAVGIGLFVYFFFISALIKGKFFPDLIDNGNSIEEQRSNKKDETMEMNSEFERMKNKLKVLKELLDDNIISLEEYEKRKVKIVDEITGDTYTGDNVASKPEEKDKLEKTVETNNVSNVAGERIIKEGVGNLCEVSVKNGKLLLTDERIIFGKLNTGKLLVMGVLANLTKGDFEFDIHLKDIKRVYMSSFRLSKKILTFETINGQIYKFAVVGIEKWMSALKEVKNDKNYNYMVEFDDSNITVDYSRRHKILIIVSLIIIVLSVGIKYLLSSPEVQENGIEAVIPLMSNTITSKDAEQNVLNKFVADELRENVTTYVEEELEIIDNEKYYKIYLRELTGWLMGIYYVEQHGDRIFMSTYYYPGVLQLVDGMLDDNRVKMISYEEAKGIFSLNNISVPNELDSFIYEGQYYCGMYIEEKDMFYWLENTGDKLWEVDCLINKSLIWEK